MTPAVLLVDDEANVINSIARLLRNEKFRILKALGGVEALKIMKEERTLALVVCDQRMPDMHGYEVLCKAAELHPDAVRVALTGHADIDNVVKCINQAKVSRFILKPWDDNAMRELCRKSVRKYLLSQRNTELQRKIGEQNRKLQQLNSQLEEKVKERTGALQKAYVQLEKTLKDVITLLVQLMEMHTAGLSAHSRRVAERSKILAEKMSVDPRNINMIYFAAMLHDLGKLALAPDILRRPVETLKRRELLKLQQHPDIAYDILKDITGFRRIAELVRHHHEMINGRGYPDALRDEEIPIGSRIIAIVDLYDKALYPDGTSVTGNPREAADAVYAKAGKSFDKKVCEVFLNQVISIQEGLSEGEVEINIENAQPGMVVTKNIISQSGIPLVKEGRRLNADMIDKLLQNEQNDPDLNHITIARRREQKKKSDYERRPSHPHFKFDDSTKGSWESPKAKEAQVIVVDDQEFAINAIRRELRSAGFDSKGFMAPQSCLDYLKLPECPEIIAIITDFRMPLMPGNEFLSEAQKIKPAVPIIVITEYATKDTIISLKSVKNLLRILPKPWDKHSLINTLKSVAGKD